MPLFTNTTDRQGVNTLSMKSCSWLAVGVVSLALPTLVFGGEKFEAPDCIKIDEILKSATPQELQFFNETKKSGLENDVLGFALGKESLLSQVYKERKNKEFNSEILQLKEMAKSGVVRGQMEADYHKFGEEFKSIKGKRKFTKAYSNLMWCSMVSAGKTELNDDNRFATGYLSLLQQLQGRATGVTGYFETTVNNCTAYKTLNTGNPYTSLESDNDSRFLVVDATLKNIDREGRLPLEGSLVIVKDGVEYKYDTTEHILSEGYGMKSINPLIKLRTKIVYRVPNEMDGDVYWKPGRNPDGMKLWCTHLSAAVN